ncbi:cysteine hydrolase family protein [Microbacterium sp. BR1]|uniref:cysteine hydrolase family protein n=1 Tax=Microbacterium sp. BR1 TaxID=1070896 RepID=UPI000C2C63A6|nr:isochorismatase family cysteine hydrolase [Microbacterium sp. BR1]
MTWREDVEALPRLAPEQFDLSIDDTALVIIDMQYVDASRDHGWGPSLRQTHPDNWSYYFDRVEGVVVPRIRTLLGAFRNAGARVIHVTLGPVLPDGSDLIPDRKNMSGAIAALTNHVGTAAHRILDAVAPIPGELVINKTSRGAFNSTAIDQMLRNMGCRGVIFVGVTTSSCVETTARDAADRGYRTVIVEDATAEIDQASHDATLRQFAVRWGRVWTVDETLEQLRLTAPEVSNT